MILLRRLLGDVLRRQRQRQGRTLREVSASARVSLGYLSEVERGQKEASSELLSAICDALDVRMSEVMREVSDELSLADGSGLSRTNRISPSLLTDLIALAGDGSRPELAAIFGGLPVAAWSGTLADRYAGAAAKAGAGVVRAKTGTLTGVHAIAGVVTTADGRLLSFAVLTDRVPADGLDSARSALDRIAAKLATCGCR